MGGRSGFRGSEANATQPSVNLLRGDGVFASRGAQYDKSFRRLTVDRILKHLASGDYLLDVTEDFRASSYWHLSKVVVFPKCRSSTFDKQAMTQFAQLLFAESHAQAHAAFPKKDDNFSYGELRALLSQYTAVVVVGDEPMSQAQDVHMDFMKHGESEQCYAFRSLFANEDFGPLGGAAAIAEGKRKAKQSQLQASAARTSQKRDHVQQMLGTPPRREMGENTLQPDVHEGLLPVASQEDAERDPSSEQQQQPWVQCDLCRAWREVSLSCMKAFDGDAPFYCRHLGKACQKRRRRLDA